MFNEYIDYKSREWKDFLRYLFTDYEYTDLDCTNNYEFDSKEYTTEVGDDDLPF
jgi:hypothetical protein